MNENDLARRIVAQLDRSLAELPTSIAQKLQAARAAALARYRPGSSSPGQSWADRLLGSQGLRQGLAVRLVLPVAIVIASLTGIIYWQTSSHYEEELETGLLAGELPLHAYIDPGFETWLTHTSYTPPQQ
ncbi:MAG TPA: DUF3619 family protein [Burkholderiales bacterium]|jgi:hypothetical protein|nr:DUF3619 family protein [Burkholderiales bacterium]